MGLAALAQTIQGRTVSTHQTGNVRADDLHAHLFFKGAEHGFIIKGAALHHDLAAQFFGAGRADDLVQCVLDHADGQTGRDVLDAGTVLLGLLHRAVHEHGAAAAQVHRAVRKQTQGGKLLDVITQGLGEGLQKAAAAGRTGFVQEDVADGTILDLEALHILAADVDDEVHIRHEVLGGGEVGHRFHQTVITAEGVLHQLFAVAGGGHAGHLQAGVFLVDLEQLLPDEGQRVAEIGLIVGVQDLALLVHDHQLDGGGAGVDADVHRAAVGTEGHPGHAVGHMPGVEFLVLLLVGKQRRLAGIGGRGGILVQCVGHIGEHKGFVRIQGGTQCHIQQAVFRAGAGHAQRLVKALAQHGAEGERPAQIQDVALDGAALCQTRNGLVDHGLVDAGGNVLGAGTLIDQGLHVALGKHAAAGSDGVGALGLLGGLVHLVGAHLEQGGHLVDESTRAAGTAAVHAHFCAVGQKQDLGILAAQLNDAVGGGHKAFDRHAGGEHLLHEGHAAAVGQTHARRAGNAQQCFLPVQLLGVNAAQQLLRLFQNMTIMSFVCRIQQGILLIQHHALDGGAADVKTYSHVVFPPKASSAGARPAHRRFSFDCRKLFGNKSSSQFAYKVIINQIVGTFNLELLFYTKKIVFSAPKVKHFVNLPDFLVLIFSVAKVLCCEQKRALYHPVQCPVCVVMPAAVRGCGPYQSQL